jgi:TolA-binding protein
MRTWMGRLGRLGCPPGWKLTRAISDGLDPGVEWHISRCNRCFAEYRALRALSVTVKAAFPVPEGMTRDSRETIGARLRVSASASASASLSGPPPAHRRFLWVMAPIAVVAVVWMGWGGIKHSWDVRAGARMVAPATPLAESRASIKAIGHARFGRVQFQPDEIVRVDEGEIELEIAPLHANERFRVVTEDGEVEVRGTSFKVSVSNQSLAAVHVWRGRVEVRSRGGALAVLDAGDDWERDAAASARTSPEGARVGAAAEAKRPDHIARASAVDVAPPRAAPGRHAKAPNAARALRMAALEPKEKSAARDDGPLPAAASFGHAWSRLRAGDAPGAAAEFAEVERLARGRDIEEDALYWRAVAVGRAGDAAGARTLFGAFLERFPASSRVGEAAAELGSLLLDSGQLRAARRAFERAALDPSARVQARAQEGLRRTQEDDR